MIKALVPKRLKLSLRFFINLLKDQRSGHLTAFAKRRDFPFDYTHALRITQKLRPNPAKVHNLSLAVSAISVVPILPNEIFSFWRIVGNPSRNNGFQPSRSILNGQVTASVGGGLCQLSGLIYFIALRANLEILERHNHSVDIYTDQTRFTPLGADAAVAFGYKDLRIRNNSGQPIYFRFQIEAENLGIALFHAGNLNEASVRFIIDPSSPHKIKVATTINGVNKTISWYEPLSIHV